MPPVYRECSREVILTDLSEGIGSREPILVDLRHANRSAAIARFPGRFRSKPDSDEGFPSLFRGRWKRARQ
jgi:hypothetical protein